MFSVNKIADGDSQGPDLSCVKSGSIMRIRQAIIADAHRIAQIHVDGWRAAYRGRMPDEILDKLDVEKRAAFWGGRLADRECGVFVVELNERVVGFCDLIPTRDKDLDPKTTAEIVAIYVDPRHWRKGAGQALCRFALETAGRENYSAVTLWCLDSNVAARSFYEKVGFHLDGATKVDQSLKSHELREVRFRIFL